MDGRPLAHVDATLPACSRTTDSSADRHVASDENQHRRPSTAASPRDAPSRQEREPAVYPALRAASQAPAIAGGARPPKSSRSAMSDRGQRKSRGRAVRRETAGRVHELHRRDLRLSIGPGSRERLSPTGSLVIGAPRSGAASRDRDCCRRQALCRWEAPIESWGGFGLSTLTRRLPARTRATPVLNGTRIPRSNARVNPAVQLFGCVKHKMGEVPEATAVKGSPPPDHV
jgi:hypothetical protein